MSDEIKVTMSGDSSPLVAQMEKLHRSIEKVTGDFSATARAAKKSGEDAGKAHRESEGQLKKLNEAAMKLRKEFESPYTRHKNEMQQLNVLYRMGKITQDEFTQASIRSKAAMQAAGQAGHSAMGGIVSQIGTAAAGFVGVGSVIGGVATAAALLKAEYDDLKQRQAKAADKQIDLGAAVRGAVFALGEDPSLSAEQFTKRLPEISRETGVSETHLARAATDVFSARGDLPAADALAALTAAARLMPDQPGQLPMLAASGIDLSKGTGQTFEAALGQLLSIGTASRVTSLKGQAENIAPAVIGLGKFGDSPTEAGAIVAAATKGLVDPTGAQSKTSAISLAQQLEAFLPQLGSTMERIAAVQSNDALRAQFLEGASFEKAFLPVARSLLGSDPETAERRSLASAQQVIVSGDAAEELFRGTIARIEALPLMQNLKAQQTLTSGAERLQAGDLAGGMSGITRRGLDETLEAANVSQFTRKLTGMKFDAATQAGGVNQLEATAAELEAEAAMRLEAIRVRTEAPDSARARFRFAGGNNAEDARVAAELSFVAQALRDLRGDPRMDEQNKLLAEQNRLVQEQNELLRKGQPGQPAAVTRKPDVQPPGKRPAADRQQTPAALP
jgi:hypothetical protein